MKRMIGVMALVVGLALGTGLPTACNGGGEGPYSGLWDLIENACSANYTFSDTIELSLSGTTTEGDVEFELYDGKTAGSDTLKILIAVETGELIFCLDPAGTMDFSQCDTLCFGLVTDATAEFYCEVGDMDLCGPVSYEQQ